MSTNIELQELLTELNDKWAMNVRQTGSIVESVDVIERGIYDDNFVVNVRVSSNIKALFFEYRVYGITGQNEPSFRIRTSPQTFTGPTRINVLSTGTQTSIGSFQHIFQPGISVEDAGITTNTKISGIMIPGSNSIMYINVDIDGDFGEGEGIDLRGIMLPFGAIGEDDYIVD